MTKMLTYSTVQSPSLAANRFAASQEIPRISRNPKLHYRTHKRPPPVSILGQLNPVHIPTSHLLQIRPNVIHPSTPRSPQWSLSLRFPHQGNLLSKTKQFAKFFGKAGAGVLCRCHQTTVNVAQLLGDKQTVLKDETELLSWFYTFLVSVPMNFGRKVRNHFFGPLMNFFW